jgi:outer membrane cobalamin receptor
MRMRTVVIILAGAGLLACSGSGRRFDPGNTNLITREQVDEYPNASAMELVQRLRPRFLQRRGQTSISNQHSPYPLVYVDGLRRGGVDELHSLPAMTIEAIEYISPADATTRWGTGHMAGVIHVTTRR